MIIVRMLGSGRRAGFVVSAAAVMLGCAWAPGQAAARPGAAGSGLVSTFAGGVGGPGPATTVPAVPCGVQFAAGRLLIADGAGRAVREVNPRTGWLTTPAGTGTYSFFLGDGGPATAAALSFPCGATIDSAGNLVIADADDGEVRVAAARTGTFYGKKMTAGDIYAVARLAGFGAFIPVDVAADRSGNLVVADNGLPQDDDASKAALVRVIAGRSGLFYGRKMRAGGMYVVAGGGMSVSGDGRPALQAGLGTLIGQVRADRAGNLLIADGPVRVVAARSGTFYGKKMRAGDIYTVAGGGTRGLGDGGPATRAEVGAGGVTVDGAGNLVIGDVGSGRVRVVAARSGTFYGKKMKARDIYTVAGGGTRGLGDGGPATRARLGSGVADDYACNPVIGDKVAVDGAGNLVIGDTGSSRVRVVAARSGTFYGKKMKARDIYTVAGNGTGPGFSGDGGPATRAELGLPSGLTTDAAGNVVIVDELRVRVVATASGTFYGQAMTRGDIYTVAGNGQFGSAGDGGPATEAAVDALDVAVDGAGNLVISDIGRVRVVAAASGTFYGQAMTAGDIYTVAGDGHRGFSGDGGPATNAEMGIGAYVGVDHAGNIVIGDAENFRVRVVAATSGTFYGQAMTAGDIYTVAGDGSNAFAGDGGPATAAGLSFPGHVAVDQAGNLVIPDTGHNRVRVVAATSGTFYGQAMTAGDIYTVAGDGTSGLSGDGGPALQAELESPGMTAVDQAGNLLIADRGNYRVQVLAATSGTFYGQAMTAGDIYTVAGDGAPGFSGDGGPAAKAAFSSPEDLTFDAAGNLLIADSGNHRVRAVTK